MRIICMIAAGSLLATAVPAAAADVTFNGLVVNLCTLTPTAGTLGAEGDGVTLSSEGAGGLPAALAVVATGGSPTLRFGAPTLTTPAAFSGNPATTVTVSSAGGPLQILSTTAVTRPLGKLLDTLTVRAKIVNADGFASGIYSVRTVVTCEQP